MEEHKMSRKTLLIVFDDTNMNNIKLVTQAEYDRLYDLIRNPIYIESLQCIGVDNLFVNEKAFYKLDIECKSIT